VNTLSAKADSFFGEPSYRRAYTQLARSRPGTLKGIQRRVLIPIHHQAAFAFVNTNLQALRHKCATSRALLAGAVREHFNYLPTGSLGLVRKYFDEARPCDVGNRSSHPVVLEHPADVQALDSEFAVALNQLVGNFVPVFVAQVSNPCVQSSNFLALLGPVVTAKLFAAKRSLRPSQFREFGFKKPGVLNFEAIGRSQEMRQSNIKSGCGKNVADFGRLGQFTSYDHEPFIGFTLQTEGLDFTVNFTVQTDSEVADMLDTKPVAFQADPVTGKESS
jgi:hypothetical protein